MERGEDDTQVMRPPFVPEAAGTSWSAGSGGLPSAWKDCYRENSKHRQRNPEGRRAEGT